MLINSQQTYPAFATIYTRKRAMQKRGSGVCTESEDLMSDDSPG
jgi:hypothetical protein